MAFWEHPDMTLEDFKLKNVGLVETVKSFVSRVFEWLDLSKGNRPSPSSWNGYLIGALRRHALREGINQPVNDDEMIARWIARELRSTDFTSVVAVKVLKITGHFGRHENVLLLKSRFRPYSRFDDADSWEGRGVVDDMHKCSRKYVTTQCVYAIDPENSEEIDDAVSAHQLGDGRIEVLIHVADPTSIVRVDSMLDREARRRNQSVYLPDCTALMYPRGLAIGQMSLSDCDWCRALTVKVIVREDGSVEDGSTDIEMSYVKVHRLTYEEADMILDIGRTDHRYRDLRLLNDVALKRLNWRKLKGLKQQSKVFGGGGVEDRAMYTDYGALQVTVGGSDDNNPAIVIKSESNGRCVWGMHGAVEELMVLCGSVVAKYATGKAIPIPFRVGRCEYSSEPTSRHDLGLPEGYVQCTSPLRRYLDCIVHYQLKASLFGDGIMTVGEIDKLIGENAEHHAHCLLSRCKQYWVAELFRRRQLTGNSFIGKVLKVDVEYLWNDNKKHHARIALQYEGLFEIVTVVENVPVGVYAYKNADVRLEVSVADPDAGTLEFRCID